MYNLNNETFRNNSIDFVFIVVISMQSLKNYLVHCGRVKRISNGDPCESAKYICLVIPIYAELAIIFTKIKASIRAVANNSEQNKSKRDRCKLSRLIVQD